jgi:hypothetical protein
MGRTHCSAISLARQIEIVAIAALTAEEAQVLLAAYRVSNACAHNGYKAIRLPTVSCIELQYSQFCAAR